MLHKINLSELGWLLTGLGPVPIGYGWAATDTGNSLDFIVLFLLVSHCKQEFGEAA